MRIVRPPSPTWRRPTCSPVEQHRRSSTPTGRSPRLEPSVRNGSRRRHSSSAGRVAATRATTSCRRCWRRSIARRRSAITSRRRAGSTTSSTSSPVEQRRSIIERMHVNAESAGFAALAAYSYAEHLAELASLSADRAELDRWLTHAWRWRRLGRFRKGTLWLDFYSALLEAEAGDRHGFGRRRHRSPSHRWASQERDVVCRPRRRGVERRRSVGARCRRGVGDVGESPSRTSSTTSRTSSRPRYAPACPTTRCGRSSTTRSRPTSGSALRGRR